MKPEDIIRPENKVYSRPRLLTDTYTHYCPDAATAWFTAS